MWTLARPVRVEEVGLKSGYGTVHAAAQVGIEFLEGRNTGHDRSCHGIRPRTSKRLY
jgi:hypothetical protein